MCDGAFLTEEYTYDALLLRDYYLDKLNENNCVDMKFGVRIRRIVKQEQTFLIETENGESFEAPFVLNATYASVNQIIDRVEGIEKNLFPIKYELCEIILCRPSEKLRDMGITVMDGPFFSIMPFGKTGLHSLTAVTFTPHVTSYESKPVFSCQSGLLGESGSCSPDQLGNCNDCAHKPDSAWAYMSHLADKYLRPEYGYAYEQSLYSMKPILKSSEVDDSRPTAIAVMSDSPVFISVLSGKINTVYDLDEFLGD